MSIDIVFKLSLNQDSLFLLLNIKVFPLVAIHQFAEPGELLKEFEAEQKRLRKEEEERRLEEEKASAELIAQFEREQVGKSV